MAAEIGHSYNKFSGRDFYRRVDGFAIDLIEGKVSRVINPGSGVGENILGLAQHDKLADGSYSVLIDIDRKGLEESRRTLADVSGHNYLPSLGFVHATADRFEGSDPNKTNHLPVKSDWGDLAILFNMIHLLKDPQWVFDEMFRTSAPGSQIITSTAYEKQRAKYKHPVTNLVLGRVVGNTRIELAKKGYRDIPKPIDFATHTEEDLIGMMRKAGYVNIVPHNYEARMNINDFRAIFSYDDFLGGSFPGVPADVSRPIVTGEVDPKTEELIKPGVLDSQFIRGNTDILKRDWLVVTARKPLK